MFVARIRQSHNPGVQHQYRTTSPQNMKIIHFLCLEINQINLVIWGCHFKCVSSAEKSFIFE